MSTSIDLGPIKRHMDDVGQQILRHVDNQIDAVQGNIGTVRHDLHLTRDELVDLRREFQAFVEQSTRTAAMQQSQTKIVDLKAQLDREFGHYSQVRRTSIGLLQSFDVGNVSNAVATTLAEELMLQTPRYWLAPALVALAAWSHDRQDIAEKSVQEAFARDRHKTSLFFALVLRRQGRLPASVRWLRHYFASLDPTALTREFAVILEAASCDAFGVEGQELLSEKLATWSKELRDSNEIVAEQINRWHDEISGHQQSLGPDEYGALRAVCPQWRDLSHGLEAASALPPLLEKYAKVRDFEAPLSTRLEDLLDDILDALVTEFDAEELPLRREVVYHEAVIEEQGDLDRARQKADLLGEALAETNDVVTLQTMGAISPDLLGIGTQTQKIAIGAAPSDFRTAVGRYCAAYRSKAPGEITFEFGPKHSNFATTHGFVGATLKASAGQAESEQRLQETWGKTMDPKIEAAKFADSYYYKPGTIAAVIALILLLINPWAGFLALLGGVAVVWFLGEQKRKACQQEVVALEKQRQEGYDFSVQLLRTAQAELADARLDFEDLDATESAVLELIDGWPTANKED